MSDKEHIIRLLDAVPAYKYGYILAFMQGLMAGEELVFPDEEVPATPKTPSEQ